MGDVPAVVFLTAGLFSTLLVYRVAMVWVYDRTRSLLVAMLMHASLTACTIILNPLTTGTALLTYRAVQVHGQRLEPHQAVNRLVLGRASALVGALLAGGYFGYALSWLGAIDELAAQRAWRSVVAGLMGLLVLLGGLLLERACRVRDDGDQPDERA